MAIEGTSANIELTIHIENDLEVDNEGQFHVLTFVYPEDADEPAEIRVEFEDIIEGLIDFYRDDPSTDGYGQLYKIANELARHVDRLREVAGYMEGFEPGEELEIDDLDEDQA